MAVSTALLAAAIVFTAGLPAFADARDISVGGVYICTITHGASGFTSYQRAVEVNRRITQVLSTPVAHRGVMSVRPMGQSAVIMVGDVLVFTVTLDDVAGTSVTPLDLARQWAQLFGQGLARAVPDAAFHVF